MLNLIDLNKYGQIFVTPSYDFHNDHRESYKIIESIFKEKKDSKAEIYIYESTTALKNPSIYLNIESSYKNKIDAMKCFKSQLQMMDYIHFLKIKTIHYNYHECYEKVR